MIHCAAIKFMNMVTNPDKCYGMKLLSLSLILWNSIPLRSPSYNDPTRV